MASDAMIRAMNGDIDILDRGPRLRRLALGLAIGGVVAVLVGSVCYGLAAEATHASRWRIGSAARAWEFIFVMAGAAGVLAFTITRVLLERRARRLAMRPPQARVVRR